MRWQWNIQQTACYTTDRSCMQQTNWTELTDRTVVDYCNFCSSHYHKPAGMYTSQFGWKPAGKSGTGRCDQDCHSGRWIWDETRKSGVRYVHDFQLGGPAGKAPPSETMIDRWHVPEELFEEVLEAAVKHSTECGSSEERKQAAAASSSNIWSKLMRSGIYECQ